MLRLLLPLLLIPAASGQIAFGPARELTDAISGGLAFAKATDMDGDGDLDVLAAESNAVRILWWENDGAGNFTRRNEWLGDGRYWHVVGLADWNGDGRPDVWMQYEPIGDDGSSASVLTYGVAVNLGGGQFADPQVLGEHATNQESAMDTLVADMNGDGRNDFVTRDGVFLADPTGTFPGPPQGLASFLWDTPDQVTTFDAGGDGDRDLLTLGIYTEHSLTFVENLGTAGFAASVALLTTDDDNKHLAHCVVGADGGHRVLVMESDHTAEGLRLQSYGIGGDGSLTPEASLPLPPYLGSRAADWRAPVATKDGRVFLFSYHASEWWQSPAQGISRLHEVKWNGLSFGLVEITSFPGLPGEMFPEMADLNGDTLPDLLLPLPWIPGVGSSISNQIAWFAGTPGGGLDSTLRQVVAGEGDLRLKSVLDMDGDGDVDVLAGTSPFLNERPESPGVTLWRNPGDSGQFLREDIAHGRDSIDIVEVRDVTGPAGTWHPSDPNHGRAWPAGRLDFLAQTIDRFNSKRRFEWFFQDESGRFHRFTAVEESGRDMLPAACADWDGDGTRDLLTNEFFEPGWVMLQFKRGDGFSFATSMTLNVSASGFQPSEVPVDLDRDGDLDLFGPVAYFGNQPAYWMENDGSGVISVIRGCPHAGVLGPDLDRDGHPDFIGQDEILLSRPGLTVESRPFPGIGRIFGANGEFADIDGDGDPDVVVGVATNGLSGYSRIQWWENRGDLRFIPGSGEGLPIAPVRWAARDDYQMGDLNGDGVSDLVVASSRSPRLEWFQIVRRAGPPAFADWIQAAGLNGHSAGPLADWDDDGVANWDEFAFGSDPAASDPFHPGRPRLVWDGSGMSFTFQRRSDAPAAGLAYPLERSLDLAEWDDWTPSFQATPATAGYERILVPLGPAGSREFFRIAVPDLP